MDTSHSHVLTFPFLEELLPVVEDKTKSVPKKKKKDQAENPRQEPVQDTAADRDHDGENVEKVKKRKKSKKQKREKSREPTNPQQTLSKGTLSIGLYNYTSMPRLVRHLKKLPIFQNFVLYDNTSRIYILLFRISWSPQIIIPRDCTLSWLYPQSRWRWYDFSSRNARLTHFTTFPVLYPKKPNHWSPHISLSVYKNSTLMSDSSHVMAHYVIYILPTILTFYRQN